MRIIVKPTSGICSDGFDVTGIKASVIIFNYHYHYGYNASWSKRFASKEKPYIKDILEDICRREGVDFNSLEVEDGYNVFNGKPLKGEEFYSKYIKSIEGSDDL